MLLTTSPAASFKQENYLQRRGVFKPQLWLRQIRQVITGSEGSHLSGDHRVHNALHHWVIIFLQEKW